MLHKTSTSDCNPDESVQNMPSFMTYLQLHLVPANKYDVKNDVERFRVFSAVGNFRPPNGIVLLLVVNRRV